MIILKLAIAQTTSNTCRAMMGAILLQNEPTYLHPASFVKILQILVHCPAS